MKSKKKLISFVGLFLGSIAATVGIASTVTANLSNNQTAVNTEMTVPNYETIVAKTQNSSAKKTPTTKSSIISSGSFVNGEHPTSGNVRIVKRNGKRFLELDKNFRTSSSGPDLVVILHRKADVIGSTVPPAYPINKKDYVVLSRLQKFNGAQSYAIPNNINLNEFKSAAIWCRQFNATFGAAKLS